MITPWRSSTIKLHIPVEKGDVWGLMENIQISELFKEVTKVREGGYREPIQMPLFNNALHTAISKSSMIVYH